MADLFMSKSVNFSGVRAPNRVVIQPMEGADGKIDGGIGELTRRRYMRFAESGAGVIWFEAVAVCPDGRANPRQLWLTEANVEEYRKLLADIRERSRLLFGYEPIIIMQATHSGRHSRPYGKPQPIVAYRRAAYEKGKEDYPYHIITDEECDRLPDYYAVSARLASKVGFDGIDVKCCHGYLFNEFLSAYTREGRYGDSLENRSRLYLSCIDSAIANKGDMFVTTRLSGYDGFAYPDGYGADSNGINLSEPLALIAELKKRGIDLVNITIGNPYVIPHINRPYVCREEDGNIGVARIVDITSRIQEVHPDINIVMSGLTYPGIAAIDFADNLLRENKCSLVGFGRMAFAYPDFYVDYLKNGRLDGKKVCVKCGNCSKMMRAGGEAGCPVRDRDVYLPLFNKYVLGKEKS